MLCNNWYELVKILTRPCNRGAMAVMNAPIHKTVGKLVSTINNFCKVLFPLNFDWIIGIMYTISTIINTKHAITAMAANVYNQINPVGMLPKISLNVGTPKFRYFWSKIYQEVDWRNAKLILRYIMYIYL